MGENLGMDGKVDRLMAAVTSGDAAEGHAALVDVIHSGFLSTQNPFGKLALESIVSVRVRRGAVIPWAGPESSIPQGWLLCDGRYELRGAYPDLAGYLGERHGPYTSNGFKLPDLRRKVVIGWGSPKPQYSLGPDNRVGATGGRERVTLGSATLPRHGHLMSSITLVAVGSHTHQAYELTSPTSALGPGHIVARRDYLASAISSTITDRADRHLHFIGGRADLQGRKTPSPITISGSKTCMSWIIKT